MLKKIFFSIIAFTGWLLSPFTWWNDAFVNLPLAYLGANLMNKLLPKSFAPAFLISYWLTNVLGIALMHVGVKQGAAKDRGCRFSWIIILIYSIISAFLIGFKIIRPL